MAVANQGGLTVLSGTIGVVPVSLIFINTLLNGTNAQNMLIPIAIQGVFIPIFTIFTLIDLITGVRASRHEAETRLGRDIKTSEYIDYNRLWDTMWKYLAVIVLTVTIMCLSFLAEITQFKVVYYTCIWFQSVIWLLANGYEFSSIGNNIEKRIGKKPSFFSFFDLFLDKLSKKTINKVDSSFDKFD